jgi:hypothetical protein
VLTFETERGAVNQGAIFAGSLIMYSYSVDKHTSTPKPCGWSSDTHCLIRSQGIDLSALPRA